MARVAAIPKLDWPFALTGAANIAVVDQDTLEDVRKCVRVLMHTPIGARPLAPDVGVPDATFTAGVNAASLRAVLEDADLGEPRATITVTARPVDASGGQRVRLSVDLADAPHGIDADAFDNL